MGKTKLRFIVPTIALLLMLLTACNRAELSEVSSAIIYEETVEPTPTLIPRLASSTHEELAEIPKPLTATATVTNLPATPAGTPTATPVLTERLSLGNNYLESENYKAAVEQFRASLMSSSLDSSEREFALFGLGQAEFALGNEIAASEAFSQYLALAANPRSADLSPESDVNGSPANTNIDIVYFNLAESYVEQGHCDAAVRAYERYLESNSELAAYIYPLIADCHFLIGDREAAIQSLAAAVQADAHPDVAVASRDRLADQYREEGDYAAALAIYEELYSGNYSDSIRGRAYYQAGTMQMLIGNFEAGWQLYEIAVEQYPTAYESYLALQAMVEAERVVDDYHRGVVDYHARVYEPATLVLNRYLSNNADHIEDAHLYLTWSYEGLGNLDAAISEIDTYIAASTEGGNSTTSSVEPAEEITEDRIVAHGEVGWIEKAKLLMRAGSAEDAVEALLTYIEKYPEGEHGPYAAWWAAALTEKLGNLELAADFYQSLAEKYPDHEDAPEALFEAGTLLENLGEVDAAETIWLQAAKTYPDRRYGAAAILRLINMLPEEEIDQWLETNPPILFEDYFSIRVSHILSDILPFEKSNSINLSSKTNDQEETEIWLKDILDLEDRTDLGVLSQALENDGRLVRGKKLWQLGRKEEAKKELETLRLDFAEDSLASYQLALFYRDLGLYRSSILAAASMLKELGVDVFQAPNFLGKLAYPVYYSDLVLAESEHNELDPLLFFALIRQESLFESFATSSAVAQGLSQVIPDTGQYIANKLEWPDYQNEDLFKPYVGIAFGAFYLAEQIDAFDGDISIALSAYNGGPGNASRWQAENDGDLDDYLQIVDFSETRRYIERIYTGHSIYRYLYGN